MSESKKIAVIIQVLILAVLFTAGFTNKEETLETEKTMEINTAEAVGDIFYMRDTGAEYETGRVFVKETIEQTLEREKQEGAEEARRIAEEEAAKRAMEASQEERALLASIIYCEAGNQSYEGQVAVGAVVMNRVRSGSFPNTVEEVIYQPGQFVPAMTGWLDQVRSSGSYTDLAMQAATAALAGESPVGDCLFFDQGGSGMQIGAHYFH